MRTRVIWMAGMFLLVSAAMSWSQSDRGKITGTVTDSTGAVIPGVVVTATEVNTGVQTPTLTNEVGAYSILNLPVGSYSVSFSKQGFKTYKRDGITLGIAQVAQLDAQMALGELAESVEVTADASILPLGDTVLGTHMPSRIVNDCL